MLAFALIRIFMWCFHKLLLITVLIQIIVLMAPTAIPFIYSYIFCHLPTALGVGHLPPSHCPAANANARGYSRGYGHS